MAKATTKKKTGTTKKELLDAAIAEAVGAGKELHLESVDFSDPNRPKTCLEVDFPILPINRVAAIEGNAGKPIYQMSKWWARRRSSVFRSMLIAAATKAPDDPGEAAKLVWDSYYGNHQKNEAFRKLKVADIFMGGGTTIVEGARLGMQMYGNDLNPVAWFVVKNELAQIDPSEVQKLLNHIEAEVKPQIMPFYACNCPRGHKGKWTQRSTGKVMSKTFDPLALKPEERGAYEYEGPEVIYTFWAKHGPCQATDCGHRTPIMSSPVIAIKALTVKAWINRSCRKCHKEFDIEQYDTRMAPAALFVCAPDEKSYSVMDEAGNYACPQCGHQHQDETAKDNGESSSLGKAKNKSVELTLLIHPDWLKGSPGKASDDSPYGGSTTDDAASTAAWYAERQKNLKLIEVRGVLPKAIVCPDTKEVFDTDSGTVPKKSTFTCMESTCGQQWDILDAVKCTGKTGPVVAYVNQGYCPQCSTEGTPYNGRFFATVAPDDALPVAVAEWHQRCDADLRAYWPRESLFSYERGNTSMLYNQPQHGYTHWWMMFNPRQLLVHAQILKSLLTTASSKFEWKTCEYVLGSFQAYIRNQNMYCFWHRSHDHFAPALSNNNFHPKDNAIEVGVYCPVGYGPWTSTSVALLDSATWARNPWELVSNEWLAEALPDLGSSLTGNSEKVFPGDVLSTSNVPVLSCGSATNLQQYADESYDLIVTDPPFGGLLHYADMADFFYVWLRLALKDQYQGVFDSEFTPRALEVIANKALENDADGFYQRLLTQCWHEASRILKPSGILAFTFHHSDDEPWVAVLESLFNAGFFLEAAYPIRSDETKGEGTKPGTFGSQQIEFDIVHVCRKRVDESQEISWARLRRQILQDVRQIQDILEHHHQAGLQEADLQVIRRGKALEYYSKHYGKVYIEKGRAFSVREALAGINQLLDDQRDSTSEVPPVDAEPYTRQFLRLFRGQSSLERGQLQKFLRGTGVSPAEFVERGWCGEKNKVFHFTHPLELAQKWKGVSRQGMGRDFDQAMFLIGACYENSGIRVQDTLNSEKFIPHPATGDVIDWFTRHGGDAPMKDAAKLAKQLYTKWVASNQPKVKAAQRTFDFAAEEA